MQSLTAWARCFVKSDDHRGANYSDSDESDRITEEGLQGYWIEDPLVGKVFIDDPAKLCILLGDNYDVINLPLKGQPETIFKYSRYIDNHIDHLRKLIEEHPGCKFMMVKGNHERLPEMDVALDQLEKEIAEKMGPGHFEIQSHFKKVGGGLFMHGDQAMNRKKYHVDEEKPRDYSNFDDRYKESLVELHRSASIQFFHDIGNRYLPWMVGRVIFPPWRCARRNLSWCHDYDKRHPDQPSKLEGTNHFITGHTHDPRTGYQIADKPSIKERIKYFFLGEAPDHRTIDPETGEPKVYFDHNTGASIFQLGRKMGDGTRRINRHCFNALSVFLDSSDVEDPNAKIMKIISFNWPKFQWPPDAKNNLPPIPPTPPVVKSEIKETVKGREEDLEPVMLRAGSFEPILRVNRLGNVFSRLRYTFLPARIPERILDL